MSAQTNELLDIHLPPIWDKIEDCDRFGESRGLWWHANHPENRLIEIGHWMLVKNQPALVKATYASLVQQAPHAISLEEEPSIAALSQGFVWGGEAVTRSIFTEKIAGRVCLVFERDWGISKRRALEVLVDPTGIGNFVNHFYYGAPPEVFETHLPVFRAALETMHAAE